MDWWAVVVLVEFKHVFSVLNDVKLDASGFNGSGRFWSGLSGFATSSGLETDLVGSRRIWTGLVSRAGALWARYRVVRFGV